MALKQRGFLFRNFEKILCALAALAVLATIVHVHRVRSARIGELERLELRIESSIRQISPPPPPPFELPSVNLADRMEATPADAVRNVFWPLLPRFYPDYTLGTGSQGTLEFAGPIDEGSIRVTPVDGRRLLAEDNGVVHPVHGDYARVLIRTGPGEGMMRITAQGHGRRHVRFVRTDDSIDVQPRAPVLVGHGVRRDMIELRFRPHPENRHHAVITEYEVARKRARDLTGAFTSVGRVRVHAAELRDEAVDILTRAGVAVDRDAGNVPTGEAAPDPEGHLYRWQDTGMEPNEVYLYRLRAVALRSRPRQSDWTPQQRVETVPVTDFRFLARGNDVVNFEIASERGGRFQRVQQDHALGDRLGGPRMDTGCTLMDYHHDALQPPYRRRIVYIDNKGRFHARWREFWATGTRDESPWPPAREDDPAPDARDAVERRDDPGTPFDPWEHFLDPDG